jgi:pimeloyl-ACP methyl ester carboxylesterase
MSKERHQSPSAKTWPRITRRGAIALATAWGASGKTWANAPVPPEMPRARFAQVNGIRMRYYEAGPRSGVPVVLCHGFPGLAASWREQIRVLADGGFRVIAPDQRGYGGTDRPKAISAYDIWNLTADLVGLLDHVGVPRSVFIGHDWGGAVAWQMGLMHPTRVCAIASLNTPFAPRLPFDPIEAARQRFGNGMYAVFFQTPGEADDLLNADVRRSLRFIMRRPPPPGGPGLRVTGLSDFPTVFKTFEPDEDHFGVLTPQDLATFVRAFERSSFTGPLNWYRNLSRNWATTAEVPQHIAAPSLLVLGREDPLIPLSSASGMERSVPRLEKVVLDQCGHWTQHEQPQRVSALLVDWLRRQDFSQARAG